MFIHKFLAYKKVVSLGGIQTFLYQKENFLSPKLFPFSFGMRQKPIIGLGLATSQSALIT